MKFRYCKSNFYPNCSTNLIYCVCNPTLDHIHSLHSLPFRGQEAGSWRKTEWENIFTKVFSKSTITKGRLLEYNLSVVELDIKCIIKIEVILNNNAFKWYWSDIMNQVAIICDVSQHVQFSCPMYCTWLLFWKHHWQLSITHWHISEFQCSTK